MIILKLNNLSNLSFTQDRVYLGHFNVVKVSVGVRKKMAKKLTSLFPARVFDFSVHTVSIPTACEWKYSQF